MTTTAERAKELYDQFSKLTDEDWATMTEEDFLQRLTQTLRQAQNDKLEEVAAHFERYSAAFSGRSFAATLRSLKSKD